VSLDTWDNIVLPANLAMNHLCAADYKNCDISLSSCSYS